MKAMSGGFIVGAARFPVQVARWEVADAGSVDGRGARARRGSGCGSPPGSHEHGDGAQRGPGAAVERDGPVIAIGIDLAHTLQGIVRAALVNIPGARHAGITIVDRSGRVSTPAATAELVAHIDQLQDEVGQGPCLDAIREHITVRCDDLNAEARWPDFAARATQLGVRSMLSFQLFVRDRDLGALNLYSSAPASFDEVDEQIGLLLASHAAVAMVGAQGRHNFAVALATRDLIGQAKGILMERRKITAKRAFELLVRASQRSNRKLHEIADDLVSTGEA